MQARHPAGQRHRTLLAALQPPARRQRATAAPQRTSCCSKPLRCHCRRRWAGRLAHRGVRKMKHLVPTFAVHGPRCNCYRLRMIVSKKKLTCVLHGRSRIVQALPQQRRQQPQHLLLHHRRQSPQQQQPHPPRCRQHNRQTPGPQPPVNSSLLQAASWQCWTRCLPLRRCDSHRPPVMCEPVATCSPRAICGLAAGVSWCASDTILFPSGGHLRWQRRRPASACWHGRSHCAAHCSVHAAEPSQLPRVVGSRAVSRPVR